MTDSSLLFLKGQLTAALTTANMVEKAAVDDISGEFQKARQCIEQSIVHINSHLLRFQNIPVSE